MPAETRKGPGHSTGGFPRVLSPTLLWTGGCLDIRYQGDVVHAHASAYLVLGRDKTMLIDTGSPNNWATIEKDVEQFLEGRPLDYVFCTHVEFPHAGLFPHWLRKYPGCVALGELRDYPLYYPEHADQMRNVQAGDSIDLGDRRMVVLPPIWRDLAETLWLFDTTERTLFVSDAFAYLHYHKNGECDRLTSEQPLPDLRMVQFFNERALFWTQHTDVTRTFADIDEMISELEPRLIATAHGGVIDVFDKMIPHVKDGMIVKPDMQGTGL